MDLVFAYDSIKDINSKQAELRQYRQFGMTASMTDKIELRKYFFKVRFCEDTPEEVLTDLWDNKMVEAMEELQKYGKEEDCLFGKLVEVVGNDSVRDWLKLKINDEQKTKILSMLKTRGSYNKSRDIKVISLVANTSMRMNMIYWKKLKSDNGVWIVNDLPIRIANEWLKCNHEYDDVFLTDSEED